MRRVLLFLPLLGFAPLGYFLGPYFDGAGILPRGSGFLISAISMFLLPWLVAALFLTNAKAAWSIRISLFISALAVQGILLFTVVPAGATSEMMGIAHRFSHEFSPDQIRVCAATLRQKQRDGTLAIRQREKGRSFLMSENALVVDDSELPFLLCGRFECVFIQPEWDTGEQRVYFSFDERTGIVCDGRKHVREFFVCSMADGVHAYRYHRP